MNDTVETIAKNIACGAHLIFTFCFKYLLSINPSFPYENSFTDAKPIQAAINIAIFSKSIEILAPSST